MKQSIVYFILFLALPLLKITHLQSFPLTQLLPSLPVAQLASPITDTIKIVPKILNDLTRDKNLELNLNVNMVKSGGNSDKNQTLISNRMVTSPTTTLPIFTTFVTPTANEIYNDSRMKQEKIPSTTSLQIINQPSTTMMPNKTNDSPIEKSTTPISVKSSTTETTDIPASLGQYQDPFKLMDMVDGFSNDVLPQDLSLRGLEEFDQYNNVYYQPPESVVHENVLSPEHSKITQNKINTKPLINKDGSLPVNSPTQYIVRVYEIAEKELENQIKTDGFYRNLIFAEHLFSKDNDEISLNNAVINVNVYTKQEKASDKEKAERNNGSGKKSEVFVEHVKPGKIEITIDNEYPIEKKNSMINDNKVDVTTAMVIDTTEETTENIQKLT